MMIAKITMAMTTMMIMMEGGNLASINSIGHDLHPALKGCHLRKTHHRNQCNQDAHDSDHDAHDDLEESKVGVADVVESYL